MRIQTSVRTVLDEWIDGDVWEEATREDHVALKNMLADALGAQYGYVSLRVRDEEVFFPIDKVVQVVVRSEF